jgi:hypothetical protein
MSTIRYAVAFCTASLIACTAGEAAAKPQFLTSPATQGQIVVDQLTGDISYCVLFASGTTPTGLCGKIGTAAPSGNNPDFEVSAPFLYNPPFGAAVFVTNTYTGQVTECTYIYNSTTHSISGNCVPIAVVP